MGLQGCDVILSFHLVLPYHDAEILCDHAVPNFRNLVPWFLRLTSSLAVSLLSHWHTMAVLSSSIIIVRLFIFSGDNDVQ